LHTASVALGKRLEIPILAVRLESYFISISRIRPSLKNEQMNTMKRFAVLFLTLSGLIVSTHAQQIVYSGISTNNLWSEGDQLDLSSDDADWIVRPNAYRVVHIDMSIMDQVVEMTQANILDDERKVITQMFMPMPDGSMDMFEVWYDPVMHPDLALNYPEITTFFGQSISDPSASIRLDRTVHGVHAMIMRDGDWIFIDPITKGNTDTYFSYYKSDFASHPDKVIPMDEVIEHDFDGGSNSGTGATSSGETMRTYRLALACTGEYTNFHGGAVMDAMSAMVTTMNRVNGIYMDELSVRMEMIANNDLLIPTTTADGYSNENGFAMLGQNQSIVDATIGTANYDIGHVFSTGGGGIAGLGVVCSNSSKAEGVTGLPMPIGDPFDVDYVAHEIGHQFRGNHSWNYCFGGGGSVIGYEPGSGSTIMAYAGLCGPDNIQSNSDPYFHAGNLQEMLNFIESGGGSICPVETSTGNNPPVADALYDAANIQTIPMNTPFELIGTGSDPDGDVISYCWEQFDLGPSVPISNPIGNTALFRSFNPVDEPIRVFPNITSVLFGVASTGETLPDYPRDLDFRLTVRDNAAAGGGVSWDDYSLDVDTVGGPFFVTGPEGPGVVWESGNWENITWEPGRTASAPYNCEFVDIYLSTDGGFTWPELLLSEAPNNGTTAIYVPELPTSEGRIKVKCSSSVFFNVNDRNLRIELGTPSGLDQNLPIPIRVYPNPASQQVQIDLGESELSGQLLVRIMDFTGKMHYQDQFAYFGQGQQLSLDVSQWPQGVYLVEIQSESGKQFSRKLSVQ
jgi:hypothetical protein